MSQASPAGTAPRLKTALHAVHVRMGAKMVEFNGWDMPVEYPASGGLIAEHMAVRKGVGIFDVSHMGDIRLHGPQALEAVQYLTMNDASHLALHQCQYSALLYPTGAFVDDVIVHRLAEKEDDYLLVINAGTREKDWNWVRENVGAFACTAEDLSQDFTQIAIQGPQSLRTLQKLTDADLSRIRPYWLAYGTVCRQPRVMIARTGYTAEDGFEIYLPPDEKLSERVWQELLEAGQEFGCIPCGLGARNTLRLEGCLPLYGHEISDQITVWEAGLDRFCKLEKTVSFLGQAALRQRKAAEQAQPTRRLAGLEMIDRGIARDGYRVVDIGGSGKEIGYVTSGSYAPFLKKSIALAYLPAAFSAVDTVVGVVIRGQAAKAKVVPTPFYRRPRPGVRS